MTLKRAGRSWHIHIKIVAACRANGLLPVDGPFGDISDDSGFIAQAKRSATLGMVGSGQYTQNKLAWPIYFFTSESSKRS